MSKTSRKSLPTVVVALCLLIAQAALFVHSSNAGVAHAAITGPAVYVNPGSSTQGAAQQIVAVSGTGFTQNSMVTITFNAPYSTDGSPLSPRTIPPTFNRAGDNRPLPPHAIPPANTLASQFPNSIVLVANTDANGNIVTSGGFGTIQITLPSTAVDGVYEVAAVDDTTAAIAATQYTIQRSSNQAMTVTPVSGSSVQIGGVVDVAIRTSTFNNGDLVSFSLQDFAASAASNAVAPGFSSLQPPAPTSLPLKILKCGSNPVPVGAGTCTASVNGDLIASVQLFTGPQPIAGLPSAPPLLSTYYYDQVYAIVAQVNPGNIYGPSNDVGKWVAAGVHLDHGQTAISLSTNQQSAGGAVTVRGTGFAANSTVDLNLVVLASNTTNACVLVNDGADFDGCFLTSVTTDSNGAFTASFSVSGTTFNVVNGGAPAYVLAEDFDAAGNRLNETATSAFTVINQIGAGTLSIATAAGGTSTTAAISSTVTVTGTAFTPNEAVDIVLAGPFSSPSTQPLAPGAPVNVPGSATCSSQTVLIVHANAAGVATGTFVVPETCNTVTVKSGRINAGAAVALTATGEQSGQSDAGTLNILATTAGISPTNGIAQIGTGLSVNLTGDGFASGEPVTFQFGFIDPFTGGITNPILSVSQAADLTGHVSIPNQTISTTLTKGGLYQLVARGLNSSFTSNVSVAIPFIPNQGNLNCPTANVLPGQPFVVSGLNFATTGVQGAMTTALLTVNFPNFQAVSVPVTSGGTFSFTVTTPLGTPANSYTLIVSGLVNNGGSFQEELRQCTITVGSTSPVVSVNPNSGPIGITATVTGAGFAPNEPIVLSLQYIGTSPLSGTDVPGTQQSIGNADANGNFSGIFTVKSTVAALIQGQYSLTATGQQTGLRARTPFFVTGGLSSPLVTNLYFAEGYTGTTAAGANANFVETISILNANNYTTTYTVTYFLEQVPGAASIIKSVGGTIGANSVVERSVNTDVGLNQKVASQVTSPAPLGAERVISRSDAAGKSLDTSSSLGQLLNLASGASSYSYYFASGEVQLTNEEYLTVLNPNNAAAHVTVTILPQTVISSTTAPTVAPIVITVPANSRYTEGIRKDLISSGLTKFGMTVTSDQPVAAERIEYYGDGIGSGKYGSATKPAGTAPFRQYIFAGTEGTAPSSGGNLLIGTGNDISELDIINPNPAAAGSATVTVAFFDKTGKAINSQQVQVDGGTRETINTNDVVGTQSDVFSVVVTSDKNIFVERPQFYGGDPSKGGTFAAANPSGSPAGLTSVAFPYLDLTGPTGAPISQTVFLYNPGATAIQVRGTYATGSVTVAQLYTVGPNSVTTVNVNADAASLPKGPLGGIFQIVQTGTSSSSNVTAVQTGNGDSFVAAAQANSPDFKMVVSNQGTYPIGAATGP